MAEKYNPYDNVLKVVKQAAEILGYEESDYEAIKYPERELKVSVPVQMDDGTVKVFEGYRIQHSTSRGPAKGGIRFHPKDVYKRQGRKRPDTWNLPCFERCC